ncbi:MAG: hypothetical protein HGB21_02480 [Nitrospirae bacterium]|nr:hypothetical protein [Nitrospirota bacterium]NTW65170.1 hypothetical protein [Nitrospirota bacterium]
MNSRSLWKYLPPAGPILSLTLISLVVVSAFLYYRAVKIQRFLEPALALSQPRNEFSKSFKQIIEREFGAKAMEGMKIKASSILIERSLLFSGDGTLKASAQVSLQRLARVFLSLMQDDRRRSEISLVLILARFPSYGAMGVNVAERMKVQRSVSLIQDALFQAEPELNIRYSTYFVGTSQPTTPHEQNMELVELRIIPSEFLHIEALDKLEKYSY